jgi:hypothetical protein
VGVSLESCEDLLRVVYLNLLEDGDSGRVDVNVMERVKEWTRVRLDLLEMNHSRILDGLVKASNAVLPESEIKGLKVIMRMVKIERDHLRSIATAIKESTVEELVTITE